MPPKRRRIEGNDDRENSPGPTSSKKRKKILNYDPHEIIQELYETIRTHKSEDGRIICEAFIRVPKRRTAADYYDVVSTPIDLLKIQQKVKTDGYDYVDQLSADVSLMLNNAKAYYKKTSQEYKDACDLMELYELTRAELVEAVFGGPARHDKTSRKSYTVKEVKEPAPAQDSEENEGHMKENGDEDEDGNENEEGEVEHPRPPRKMSVDRGQSVSEDLSDDLEQLFAAIVTTKDGDRDISQAFQLLPSKTKYPQYHEVIKNPIDLKTIATKIQDSVYKSLDELEKDLLLMVKNAKTFNEPKSLIYRDALTLKRVITERKRELEYKKSGQAKSSERLRIKVDRGNIQKMSAVCAALKYQSEEEEGQSSHYDVDSEGDAEGNGLEEDDPQWILFNHVKKYAGSDGEPLSEPFVKLPSKKFYPDYYKEIKKPMSLQKIQYKIEMNLYETLLDLAQDFHLTFANAKKYNQDESQLYKDAVELDKVMMEKFRDLEPELAEEFIELCANEVEHEDVDNDDDDDDDDDDDSRKEEEEEDTVSTPTQPKRSRKSVGTLANTPESDKKRSSKKVADDSLKKRLKTLFTTVFDYSDVNGRLLRPIFSVLPSRKDYPDYYQVIMEPIDLSMIEAKLKSDKYPNEQALLSDFELMFNNARHYNEEGSQVFQDANTLDRILKARWKQMSQTLRTPGSKGKSKVTAANPLSQKLQELYESVRDFQDRSGRALSSPFIKLPNKADYPDYYEVIKRPIDMQRIQQKMMTNQYENVEDMVSDFVQMFDNACKYNEPESIIYKDSLTLQRVCFQRKVELTADSGTDVPDVKAMVQELMTNLFISTYNYEDNEGRCYSDSFAELAEKDRSQPQPQAGDEAVEPPMTFDQIKKNLDKKRYRRIDCFQDDMFKVFERARKLSRTDSQLYEDAVEMQNYFIKTRDELCKNGELLLTPALSYTERHLAQDLEVEQKEKQMIEKMEEEEKKKNAEEEADNGEEECTFKDQTYAKGDFVYIQSRDTPEPHIMVIESFDTDENGQKVIKGNWFYRPNETYHLATRKFLEKEVFRSDTCHGTPMSEIAGRCCVMNVRDYFKLRPEGIPDKDVYICESRYSVRHRCFKKIKIWQTPESENLTYVQREVPLRPTRVASVFADKESNQGALDESDTIIDKKRVLVPSEGESEDGNTYYDQYVQGTECYKNGDGVYINNPRGGQSILARIDKMWTDNLGEAFFHYACFLRPSEVEHPPTRLFYKNEVFQASFEDCALIKNIVGKCSILHMKDYCSSRPTEISEQDVFITESKYHDADKSIKRQKCLKKYTLSPKVVDDEVYFFRKPIVLEKEPSPLLMKSTQEDNLYVDTEDSHEIEPEASNDGLSVTNDVPSPAPTKSSKKKTPNPRRQPSGYIVFAGEIRKQIVADNPSCSFGDISKIVGTKWRTLSKTEKDVFEEKAKKIAEEMAAKQQEADKALNESIRSQSPWSDYGAAQTPPGHPPHPVPEAYQGYPPHAHPPHPGPYYGHAPLAYADGRMTPPMVPGHPLASAMLVNGQQNFILGQTPGPQQCPPSPVFVSVPPQSQKLLHSEAYIRYIEGLSMESRCISDWDRTLSITQDTATVQPESNLPIQWLSQGAGCHGNVTNALWALRDFMLKDAINIARTVPFDDL